jgi:hypothetical protein
VEGRCNAPDTDWIAWLARSGGRWTATDRPKHGRNQEVTIMAELTEKKRDSLKSSQYGLPEERKYPMPDKSHARNAKARASQQKDKGNLTASEKAKIDRKADRILNK